MHTIIRRSVTASLAAALVMLLAACDDDQATGPGTQPSLTLQLTDAPSAQVERAWVEITAIEIQGTGGTTTLLEESTGLVELTELADETREIVSDRTLEPGQYTQLRVIVGDAALETTGGTVFSKGEAASRLGLSADGSLQCPSCSQTGIKVNLPDGGIDLQTESRLVVLDFDVRQSFGRQAGASGTWVMTPLIVASDAQASGTIVGRLAVDSAASLPTCGDRKTRVTDFVPQAVDPATGEVVKSGSVASDSTYRIRFLSPADYDAEYAGQVTVDSTTAIDFSATADPGQVTVESGQEVTVDYTIDSAACGTPGS